MLQMQVATSVTNNDLKELPCDSEANFSQTIFFPAHQQCPANMTAQTRILLSKAHDVFDLQNVAWEKIIPLHRWRKLT